MENLESFLTAYENNLKYFDIDVFQFEIMDIPYQIEVLDKDYNKLTLEQQKKFIQMNNKLIGLIKKSKPKNEMQKNILQKVKESVELKLNKHLKVA